MSVCVTKVLPSDPVMLLSVINTDLRDFYPSLDALCEDRNLDKQGLVDRLALINYTYDEKRNQFI
ncbi:hypothetical protein M2145_000383 [Lachnospiraceae bacterium PF1-21]|uniref:DUF4250 domain-containing protein n=1 Tax=Ohessyouella blattaphilus TaxID=2949333 RepID=A0ABT1EES0_9FIRM|nr:DUF4250 domain-containing protein [Ohessyouella blattaphilus]MCP1109199.1 DUF4250 domain-containing protein [Ohessyouella blattaphilus]MCR8562593.1 DUF4250 domain-containing protein [Ohessyouella blattaphilus]MDL2250489.1 DUF4250 domain-containing protein [Lachnospiraceae bacterium OttesenSCG-928-J05]